MSVAVPIAHLRLAIEIESDPIAGSIIAGSGEDETRFSGWVDLVAAIEAARRARPDVANTGAATSGATNVPGGMEGRDWAV
jgi:hypothetical protein